MSAALAEIFPEGMSRITVRGFLASISRSKYLLKAIAALRAKTMQSTTANNKYQLNGLAVVVTPKKNPIKAKGIANMEWANKTKEKNFFINLLKTDYSDLLAE